MNRIVTLSAIAMFAVVLGLGVVGPAMAAKQVNPNSSADLESVITLKKRLMKIQEKLHLHNGM